MSADPRFETFKAAYQRDGAAIVALRRIDDLETPVSAALKLGPDTTGLFLLESVQGGESRGRFSVIGLEPDLVFRARDAKAEISQGGFGDADFAPCPQATPLEALRALIADNALPIPEGLPPMAAGLFGYLAYDTVRWIEKLPPTDADPLGAPDALLLRPTITLMFDGVRQEIIIATTARRERDGADAASAFAAANARLQRAVAMLDRPAPDVRPREGQPETFSPKASLTPERFHEMVKTAKNYIRAGDIFQVVPSQRFQAPFKHPPFSLYRALRRTNPSPFMFYFAFDGFNVVGASPEILVRVRDGRVTVRPIAGTRPRGKTTAEDRQLEEDLLADPKELAEHLMLLDLGRNDVGRVAAPSGKPSNDPSWPERSSVRVTERFIVERYSHVMHIVSNVEGRLDPDKDMLDALFAGFPAGTTSGAPKVRAMEIINELEPHKRGVYAGGVGYFSANGEMDMCIALRTGVVKDGVLHVQAGGGVVLDSDPELERQETEHKSRALFRAASEAGWFV
ncbi:MAG: anthranilate synthase component I [Caulobacterales bacterium]